MTQTTKRALAASLKKLLTKKTLDKITVKDIVEDCGVNRQTFYYHFQDVYDLLEWIFITEARRVLDGKKTYESWRQGILQAFQYVKDNQTLIMNTYHSIRRESLERYLYQVVYQLLMDVINELPEGTGVSEENKGFIAHFYKYPFVGLMLDWVRSGMREAPEDIIDKLSRLITGDIKRALNKYKQ